MDYEILELTAVYARIRVGNVIIQISKEKIIGYRKTADNDYRFRMQGSPKVGVLDQTTGEAVLNAFGLELL